MFYGDDFDCLFSDRKYNEFLTYELKDIKIVKDKIKDVYYKYGCEWDIIEVYRDKKLNNFNQY